MGKANKAKYRVIRNDCRGFNNCHCQFGTNLIIVLKFVESPVKYVTKLGVWFY